MKKLRLLHYFLTAGLLSCIKLQRVILLFLSVSLFGSLQAGVVTEQQALQKAEQFLKGKKIKSSAITRGEKKSGACFDNAFYVFNVENNGGFVIISGDDRTPEILGYATNGEMDLDNLPSNVKAWLQGYQKQIQALDLQKTRRTTRGGGDWTAVDKDHTLIKTKWGQGNPYNLKCPVLKNENDEDQNCVTGCVATAIAQIMNYWRCPADGNLRSLAGYDVQEWDDVNNTSVTLFTVPAIDAVTIDWTKLKESYRSDYTEEEAQEVAKLMRHVGQSEYMQYGLDGSGAVTAQGNWLQNFGYNKAGAQFIDRDNYSTEEWEEIIYNEVSNKRPVLYSGRSNKGGHAFICEGYAGDGRFWINWGWSGSCDGQYLLSVLNRDATGVGPTAEGVDLGEGYNFSQGAYIGIQPAQGNEGTVFTATSTEGQEITFMISSDVDGNRACVVGDGTNLAIDKTYTGALTIPSEVSYEDKTYDVVAISQGAFNSSQVTAVNLPATLKKLCSGAFNNCNNLTSLLIPKSVTDIGIEALVGCFYLSTLTVEEGNAKYTSANNAIIENGTKIILGSNSTSEIPNGVTEIGNCAFETRLSMTLTIPQTVTKIGGSAFAWCYNCAFTVEYEEPLEISDDTFYGVGDRNCVLKVPTGTKDAYKQAPGWRAFGDNIFEGDEGTEFKAQVGGNEFEILFTITGKNTVKVGNAGSQFDKQAVDRDLFQGDQPAQTAINIPETVEYNGTTYKVTEIGDYAFRFITFKTISLPSKLNKIGTWAFVDNWNVQELVIPKNVTEISEGAIFNCGNLTTLAIADGGNDKYTSPNNNVIIENGTKILAGIRTTIISKDIKAIGAHAFRGMYDVAMTIPQSVTAIGQWAFADCSNCIFTVESGTPLEISDNTFSYAGNNNCVLKVPAGAKDAYKQAPGWKAFGENIMEGDEGTEFQEEVDNGLSMWFTVIGNNEVKVGRLTGGRAVDGDLFIGIDGNAPVRTSITIPETVTHKGTTYNITAIGENAFANIWMESITLPNTIKEIAPYSFDDCENLRAFEVPASVTSIGISAFASCSSLTSLTVAANNSVYESPEGSNAIIEKGTKTLISGIKNTVIPTDVKMIGDNAFRHFAQLRITIPKNVTEIGYGAFADCYNGTIITVEYTDLSTVIVGKDAFRGASENNSLLRVPNGMVAEYQAANGWSAFGDNITDGDEGIEFQATLEDGLEMWFTVTGKDEVKVGHQAGDWNNIAVDASLFRRNEGNPPQKTSIIIPATITNPQSKKSYSVTEIGNYAFFNLEQLLAVEIPATVTSIGENAFNSWNLTKVKLKAEAPFELTSEYIFSDNARDNGVLYVQNKADIDTYKTKWGFNHVFVTGGIEFMSGTVAEHCVNNWGDDDGILTEAEAKAVTSEMMFPSGTSPFESNNFMISFDELQYFGITSIPNRAFSGCCMRSVKIPEGVTTIGNEAFMSNEFETIDFPNSLTKMGRNVLLNNRNLSTINGGNQIITTENGLYYGKITEFRDGEDEEEIMPKLSLIRVGVNTSGKVSVKEGTEKIEQGAFLNCSKVTGVTLPKSLNNIEGDFEDCPSLATIEVAEGNEFFMADDNVLYATWGSNTLQQLILCGRQNTVVTIPESVRSINGRAFADCSNVISVILPSSLSYIGWAAFENCTSLAEITLPANVSEISGQAFLNCKNLKNVYSRIKNVANVLLIENAFLDRDENWNYSKRDATLWVPTGYVDLYKEKGWNNYFTAIKEDASLDGLTVGDQFVFQDDNGLKLRYKITSLGETVNTCELYRGNNSSAIEKRPESFDNNLTIPEVVEDENGKKYQVTGIGDHALEECGLISVTLPSGLTYIGEGALAGNQDLTSIELPASLTRMARGALNNWELMQVTANMETPALIEEETFSNNTYNNGTLMVPVGTKNAYKADDNWKRFNNIYSGNEGTEFKAKGENDFEILFTITGENTVKVGSKVSQDENQAVDRVLFNGDDNIRPTQTAIIIPETVEYNNKTYTVTEIGNYAFRGIGFKTISLPSTLTKIGTWVFVDNWNVKELVIPKSVTEISEGAILNCGNLTTLTVADGGNDKYTSVNNAIIEYGTKIIIGTKTTVIPDDVIAIGARAFESVSNMNLTIPQKVTTIGEYAFAWCDNCIIKVEYETPIAINENTFEEASRNHCILKVPTGTKAAYQTATGWKAFGENILEGDLGTEFKAQVGGNAFDMTFTITGENTVKVGSLTANWDTPAVDRVLFNGDENTQPSQTAIVVPETVEYKGKTYTVTEIGDLAFCEVQFATITLPSTLLKISREAIAYNWNVREFRIPNSVTEISESSIYGCGNLTLLKVEDGDNTKYTSPNNNVIIENGTKIIVGTRTTIIPDGVTQIGENAFRNVSDMNLTIPLTVATIGEQAFAYCRNCVFTVKYETPITINENTFWDVHRNNCTLIVPKNKKSTYLATEGWNEFPESSVIERDFDNVFSALTKEGVDVVYSIIDANAKTVQVGEGIAGSPAISKTTVAVTIPAEVNGYTVVSIGDYAFQNTQSLREVVIPTSVTSIGSYAFDTSGLSEVSIPSSVTSIGEMAFNMNARLMKIIVNMQTPFDINENVFSNDDANVDTYGRATLVVPAGKINDYKAVSSWSKFATVTDALPVEFTKVYNDVEMVFTITGDNTVQVGYQTGNWEKRAIPNSDDRDKVVNRDISIPSTVSYNYQDYTVTAIGDYAFNCMLMKTITLPNTIQAIGELAFWSANLMRSFELPSGVTSIGARAFGANLLTSLTVAAGNTKYSSPEGSNAIIETSTNKLVVGIASTVIPASVTTIGSYAFTNQEGLVLTIPQTITAIENFAFEGSNGVITVGWETPLAIGENAFSGIQSSMVLRVPSGCKKAYEEAEGWNRFNPNIKEGDDGAVFKANTTEGVEMTFMVVDANAKTAQVGVGGFGNGARAIEQDTKGTLTIPATVNGYTVVALADYSLRNCYNLTSISIPETVVSIGEEGLANCYRVTEFMVDAENPSFCAVDGIMFTKDMKTLLYYPAMSNRTEYSVPNGVETLGAYAFEQSQNLKTVTLPEGLKTIEECAFMDCYYIETINIPASLETLGNQAFGYCNGMLNYNVAEGNTHFSSLDGVLFNADQTKLIQYPGGKTGSYVIPNSVTSIGASAFGTVSLSELTIPNSVTEFGGYAFTYCHNMTVIRSLIENPRDIDETVFSGIGYKTILYVPKGLKSKYLSCGNWDKIPCLMEDTGVTYEVLNDQVVVTAADKEKVDGNFNIQANLMVNNEEMAVTAIAADAFKGTDVMKSVMIPASIETIGDGAFANCGNLTQVVNMNTTPINLTPANNNSRALTRGINASQFSGVNEDCMLFVLKDAKSNYQNAAGWCNFHIESFAGLGDVNYDEDINVTDVVVEVNQILCKDPGKFVFTIGDMNADDEVNVTDVVMMVNVILGRAHSRGVEFIDNQPVSTAHDYLRLESAEDGSLSLCLDNVAQYVAAQFDVRVSEGQSLDKVKKGDRSGSHQLVMAKIGDDLYRVVMYGFGDAVFAGQSGEVVNLGISGEGDVSVENITFVSGNKISRKFADMSSNTRGTTGIDAIDMTFDAPADIYDMNGRLLRKGAKTTQGLKPDVYIVNGKKVIVR